jgi:hypothetical protein
VGECRGKRSNNISQYAFCKASKQRILMDDIPLFPKLDNFFSGEEFSKRTIFLIVEEDVLVDKIVEISHDIMGDFNLPNTGILAVLPVIQTYGLNRMDI